MALLVGLVIDSGFPVDRHRPRILEPAKALIGNIRIPCWPPLLVMFQHARWGLVDWACQGSRTRLDVLEKVRREQHHWPSIAGWLINEYVEHHTGSTESLMRLRLWHDIKRQCAQWHDRRDAIQQAFARSVANSDVCTDEEWATAVTNIVIDGVEVRALNTRRLLSTEGREMKHCSADRFMSCKAGRSLVFSLRDATPRGRDYARSTLEVSRSGTAAAEVPSAWAAAQLVSANNGPAHERHVAVAHKVVALLNERGGEAGWAT